MSTWTLLLYLVGDRDAILHIASDRWTLAIGFLFVLSAGFARNYARKDLRREPWHLLMPFAASVVSSFGLFVVIYALAWWHSAATIGFWMSYLSFLGLYWLTAPLAWIYAIPIERWLPRIAAVKTRLGMLAAVATWRVVLMIRVLSIVVQDNGDAVCSLVLTYVSALALLAIFLTTDRKIHTESGPKVFDGMGAIGPVARREKLFLRAAGCLVSASALGLLVIGIIAAANTHEAAGTWNFSRFTVARLPAPQLNIWIVVVVSTFGWLFILPITQTRLALAEEVSNLARSGELEKAMRLMADKTRIAFPPHWEPPPDSDFAQEVGSPSFLDTVELTIANERLDWVLRSYRSQLADFVDDAMWYWDTKQLVQLARVLDRVHDGARLAGRALAALGNLHDQLEFHREIESGVAGDKARSDWMDAGGVDPEPEFTSERVAAVNALHRLAGVAVAVEQ